MPPDISPNADLAESLGRPARPSLVGTSKSAAHLFFAAPTAFEWPVGDIVADHLTTKLALPTELRDRMALTIHEAVSNAIIHGNLAIAGTLGGDLEYYEKMSEMIGLRLSDPVARVRRCALRARWNATCIFVRITDEGAGFTPSIPDDLTRPGGRGIPIIAGLASRCRWLRCGRTIIMRFAR